MNFGRYIFDPRAVGFGGKWRRVFKEGNSYGSHPDLSLSHILLHTHLRSHASYRSAQRVDCAV